MRTSQVLMSVMVLGSVLPAAAASAENYGELLARGEKLMDEARYEESLALFRRALEQNPDDPRVHYLIGRNYHYMTDFEPGIERLGEAVRLAPEFADAYCYMAYAQGGRADELAGLGGVANQAAAARLRTSAKVNMDKALDIEPGNACANAGLAVVDIRVFRDYEAAFKKLARALQTDPNRTTALIYMGWCLLNRGDFDAADSFLEKAAGLIAERDAWAWFTIGEGYAEFKQWAKALPYIEKTLELDPGYEKGAAQKLVRKIRSHL